jgi:hypothetical protein
LVILSSIVARTSQSTAVVQQPDSMPGTAARLTVLPWVNSPAVCREHNSPKGA